MGIGEGNTKQLIFKSTYNYTCNIKEQNVIARMAYAVRIRSCVVKEEKSLLSYCFMW